MNHHQTEKTSMFNKMLIFFANPLNTAIWANFPRLVKEIAHFISVFKLFSNYIQQHQADNLGVTTGKNDSFIAMINILVAKAQLAYVWADDEGDAKLSEIFDVQKSDFGGISAIKALTKVKNIRDLLQANITSLASLQLSEADITALNNAITSYENAVATIGTIKAHKTAGTQGIDTVMQPLNKSLDLIDYMIVNTYSESNPAMVNDYLLTRHIDKLPTRHNGISMHISDSVSKADLQGVTLTINGKSSTSDIDGLAEIIKIKAGSYMLTVSMNGYVSQEIKVVIERGKVSYYEIQLIKG